jgi:ribosome-associated translation inhibitor RaiA
MVSPLYCSKDKEDNYYSLGGNHNDFDEYQRETIKLTTAMKIQINTDKTINGDERHQTFYTSQIAEELKRYESHITRIEVHLSDENGKKEGMNDIRCLLEARLERKQPIAVSCQDDTVELAVSGAIAKLITALETILERTANY